MTYVTLAIVVVLVAVLHHSTITAATAAGDTNDQPPVATVNTSDTSATSTDSATATPDSVHTLMQNKGGGDQLGSTLNKNADAYQSHQKACEAGYPCSKDQWCSPKQRICRPCSDLDRWCNETFIIHQNYTTCEDYCYRSQVKKTTQCEAERVEDQRQNRLLEQTLREAETNLNATMKQAADTNVTCSTTIDQLNQQVKILSDKVDQKQDERDEMQADRDRLRERVESLKEEKESAGGQVRALQTGIAVCVVISLVAIGLAITYGPRIHRFIGNKFGTKQSDAEQETEAPTSSTSLIAEEGKAPVQADRNSICRDEYCIPGNGGRALDAHVPGDCAVSP